MDLIQLEYFLTVAWLQHVSLAAEELNVGQSTISMALKRLENELGVDLFDKSNRHQKVLTPLGILFKRRVENIFKEIKSAKAELNASQSSETVITIAMDDDGILNMGCIDVLKKHPNIKIIHKYTTTEDALKMVRFGKADFSITVKPSNIPELESHFLTSTMIGLLVSKQHWTAQRKVVFLDELKDEAFITMPNGLSFRATTDEIFERMFFEPRIIAETSDLHSLRMMVAENIGISFATERSLFKIKQSTAEGSNSAFKNLTMVPIGDIIMPKMEYITTRSKTDISETVWFVYIYYIQCFLEEVEQLHKARGELWSDFV